MAARALCPLSFYFRPALSAHPGRASSEPSLPAACSSSASASGSQSFPDHLLNGPSASPRETAPPAEANRPAWDAAGAFPALGKPALFPTFSLQEQT